MDDVLQWFVKTIPVKQDYLRKYSHEELLEEPLLPQLQKKYGLTKAQSDHFFRAAYWYLMDRNILKIEAKCGGDPEQGYLDYAFSQPLTEQDIRELTAAIVQGYERFLRS